MTQAYPLQWPEGWGRTPTHKRRHNHRFDVTPGKARQELVWEIERMGGRHIVISTNIPVRRDGFPYAAARGREPDDRGVAVYFVRDGRQMCFACDQWDLVHHNMRAIEKTIWALRGLERWGASEAMERAFTGFEALPPPSGWRQDLGFARDDNPTITEIRIRFRDLAKTHHPDHGGDVKSFQKLDAAYRKACEELRA